MRRILDLFKAYALDVFLFLWMVAIHLAIILVLILIAYFLFN